MEINTNNFNRNDNEKEENNENINKNNNQKLLDRKQPTEGNSKMKERLIKNSVLNGKKNKGYVRVFRNYIKKKDKLRKDIIQNRFNQWINVSLKDSIIKKRIIIRISVSREKDNEFKMEKGNEEEKSKSVNKRIIKSIDNLEYPQYNNKKEDINKIINISNENINKNNTEYKYNNNFPHYEIAKRIKNYKGADYKKDNNINNNYINNSNSKPEKNKIIDISIEKPKTSPRININNKTKNIFPVTNLSNQFKEINYYNNKNNNNNNYIKFEPQNLENSNTSKKDTNSNINTIYNNMSIAYTSSSKKDKKDSNAISNTNYKDNSQKIINEYIPQGYYRKYDGYHDIKNINTSMPNKEILNYSNTSKQSENNQYNPYKLKKLILNKKEPSGNNSFAQENKNKYNTYKMNTYHNYNKNNYKNKSNESDIFGKNSNLTSKKVSNLTYSSQSSQKQAKPALKGGVTTVIQHYSGRRNQYKQLDNNSLKK